MNENYPVSSRSYLNHLEKRHALKYQIYIILTWSICAVAYLPGWVLALAHACVMGLVCLVANHALLPLYRAAADRQLRLAQLLAHICAVQFQLVGGDAPLYVCMSWKERLLLV